MVTRYSNGSMQVRVHSEKVLKKLIEEDVNIKELVNRIKAESENDSETVSLLVNIVLTHLFQETLPSGTDINLHYFQHFSAKSNNLLV